MLRQRLPSPSHNQISPSPKPLQFNSQHLHLMESTSPQPIFNHRRNKSLSATCDYHSSDKKLVLQNKQTHIRKRSVMQEESQSCFNKNVTLINSKIQNILQNYKQYNDAHLQAKKLSIQKFSNIPKQEKNRRQMNKQNQMVNQKSSRPMKQNMRKCEHILKQRKNESCSLLSYISDDNTTFQTKKMSTNDSLFQLQLSKELSDENKQEQNLSYSSTTQNNANQVIKIPKIFQKLKLNSQKLITKKVDVEESDSKRSFSQQKDKLVSLLYNQILLDQRFIKAKHWFRMYKKEHKWWLLQRQLKKYRLWINQLTMKATFMTKTEEQGPQQLIDADKFSVKTLVLSFKQAQEHWLSKILNSFEYQSLKQQGFIQSNLDLSKKGHISIEDFLRFINIELKTFYTNRQIQLIYLRLKQSQNLQFYDIIEKITKSMA